MEKDSPRMPTIGGWSCKSGFSSTPAAELFDLFNPCEDRAGDRLIVGVDGEDLGHVAFAFLEQHGWAMAGAFFAELVVQGLVEGAHASVDAGIQLGSREEQFHLGFFVFGQRGSSNLRCRVDLLSGTTASASRGSIGRSGATGSVDRTVDGIGRAGATRATGSGECCCQAYRLTRNFERRDVPLPGHQDGSLHTNTFRPPDFRPADIGAHRTVAGRLRPDEHPVRVALVLRNIRLYPLDHGRNIFGGIVPILTR